MHRHCNIGSHSDVSMNVLYFYKIPLNLIKIYRKESLTPGSHFGWCFLKVAFQSEKSKLSNTQILRDLIVSVKLKHQQNICKAVKLVVPQSIV